MNGNAKWIGLAVGTLVIGALFGTFTDFIGTGTDATLAKTPAITDLQNEVAKLKAVDDGFREDHGEFRTDIAVNQTKAEANKDGVNQLRGAILND